MQFNTLAMLPLVSQLGEHLKSAFDYAVKLKAEGKSFDAESLAFWLNMKLQTWNPKLKDKDLLDEATRKAAARFLAGVAINMMK